MNILWWSGGITSAVACHLALKKYSKTRIIMIETYNEHDDTYRFKNDCEKLYGKKIESISAIPNKYDSIKDVWIEYLSLNVAHGAICSAELKRQVRIDFQKRNYYESQVFGFDYDKKEINRFNNLVKNYPSSKAVAPLINRKITKQDCFDFFSKIGIKAPISYELGFNNNNCLGTGCVQGGVSYWKKYKKEFPIRFNDMAELEHFLTNEKGKPVTCLRDQSKSAKKSGLFQVFLKPHPQFPNYKDLSMMSGRAKESYFECNGFCGTQVNLFNKGA